MTQQQTREKRDKFRKIYSTIEETGASARRDRYAKFMAARFPEASEDYAREWAQRFRDGKHMHAMDMKSQRAFLNVLMIDVDGTAAEFNPEVLAEFKKDVQEERPALKR